MKTIKKQAKILGAGISGLSTAITLVKNDIDALVFEKEDHAGGRFKNDFQALRAFENSNIDPISEFLQLGISIEPYKKIHRIIRFSPTYSFEVVSSKTPLYHLVSRGKNPTSLDSQLACQFLKYNGEIKYNSDVDPKTMDIIASGPQKIDSLGYGEIYEDANIDDAIYVFLNTKNSPYGYLYILPGTRKGEAEIINGTSNPNINMNTLKALYEDMIHNNTELQRILEGSTKKSVQYGMSCCTRIDALYNNGKYYVGEAAGLQDPSAFFGIRYAIMSGYLAATSFLTGKEYTELITQSLGKQLEFDQKRREVFKMITNKKLDEMFQSIVEKFGNTLTLQQYHSLRGAGI